MALSKIKATGITDASITAAHIAADTIAAGDIAANAVTASELADNAVDTAAIADDAVTVAKMADDAIGADQLASNAVVNASVASGAAIDATKIADGSVTSAEFQHINSLSSNAQTQITARLPLAGGTMSGETIFADQLVTRPYIKDYAEVYTASSGNGSTTLDLAAGNVFQHTASGGNVTFVFSNPPASGRAGSFTLKWIQDSSDRTITWPGSVDWAGGSAPDVTSGNAKVDVYTFFTVDGGTIWYGFQAGAEMGQGVSMPLGAERQTLMAAAAGGGANYFGDGSDGALTTSGNVTHTVQNKNGSYDGDMVVKQYTTLTISAGHTMTTDQACKGMLIYVTGNCTINGTLTMSSRGAHYTSTETANPIDSTTDTIWMPMFTASTGSQNLTVETADFGSAGSAATTAVANQPGIAGNGTLFTISGAAGGAKGGGSNGGFPGSAGAGGTLSASSNEMWCQNGGGGGGGAGQESSGSGHGGTGGT